MCIFHYFFPYTNTHLVVNRYIWAIAPIAAHHCNWWNSSNLPTECAFRQESSSTLRPCHSEGTRATLDLSSTHTPSVDVVLLLRTARAALLCVVAVAARCGKNKIFAAKYTKVRVGFQAPGWLSGSGTPSPELLAGSRDFDHVEHFMPPTSRRGTL